MVIDFDSLTEATAGAVGSLLSTTALYPLDTCKTKFQAETKQAGEDSRYKSLLDVLREAIASNRILSLYQGVHTKNIQSVIAGFTYFYSYNFIKQAYLTRSRKASMGTGANLIVAALAGVCTVCVTQPLDTLSARMQTSGPGKSKGLFRLLKERGLSQSFDGLGASLLLTVNPAIQYTIFEQLKMRLLKAAMKNNLIAVNPITQVTEAAPLAVPVALSAFSAFWLGALSKTAATMMTYPAIRCKVMMQRAETEEETQRIVDGDRGAGPPKNMFQALRLIWHSEGLKGLYKGIHAQILKTVLAAALMLMIKEKVSEGTRSSMLLLRKAMEERNSRIKLS